MQGSLFDGQDCRGKSVVAIVVVPKTYTNNATRAFPLAAPTLWNMLPSSVKSVGNIAKFRRHLKTYLYNFA